MEPKLDAILTEIIQWRLKYIEARVKDPKVIKEMKQEYLRLSIRIMEADGVVIKEEVKLARFLGQLLEKAKQRAFCESLPLHLELDKIENLQK